MSTANRAVSTNPELHVILGAGPVGLAVMDELVARGKRVRIVNRRGVNTLPQGVESLTGEITTPEFARKAVEGATHVYFALNPPYDKWPELFPALQAAAIEATAAVGAKLIAMDNLYMYGPTGGAPMTESTPYRPNTVKGRLRAKMSEDLMAAHRAGKVRLAVGRASDFVGPRVLDSSMGDRVIYPALEGRAASVLGNPDMPHTYTYMPDIGKALVILGEREEAIGQIWHIPSPKTVTTRQFIEMIGNEIGKPAKVSPAPKLILKAMGLFSPLIRSVAEMTGEFEEPFILDHSKFARAFGDIATPLPTVIRDTVRWYQGNPKPAGH